MQGKFVTAEARSRYMEDAILYPLFTRFLLGTEVLRGKKRNKRKITLNRPNIQNKACQKQGIFQDNL